MYIIRPIDFFFYNSDSLMVLGGATVNQSSHLENFNSSHWSVDYSFQAIP